MARARNIKPGFFTNDVLAEVDPLGRLLFAGLWTIADREGRMEDRPKKIKAQVLPYDDCACDSLLQDLHQHGFILRYEVDGQRYIQIVKWAEHQNPHVKEAESTIPAPDKNSASTVQETECASEIPERAGLIPDSLNLIPDSGLLDDCAEPQSDSTPAVVAIPIIGGKEFPIAQRQADEWAAAYPAVDVIRQLAAMRQWCLANPTKRKTARGVLAFCNSWLMREQDKPHAQARASPTPGLNKQEALEQRNREVAERLARGMA